MAERGTVAAELRRAEQRFEGAGIDAPRIQAQALLCHALSVDRAGLLARLRDPLPSATIERFEELVQRRLAHEPLQYLLGRASFLDFELQVGPGVFIPRPETEQLVARALDAWPVASRLAIDLCTGSGAVAIALARARPHATIVAVDLSPLALACAAANARALGVAERVRLVRADLLGAMATPPARPVGLLACNPPYAARADVVQPEVRDWEPEMAWCGGTVGIEIYRQIARRAPELLEPGAPMVLELGYGQEAAVSELLTADGRWEAPRVEADFQGIPRVLTVRRAARTERGAPA